MDISKLIHDKAKVSSALMYKGNAIVAKEACKVVIPSKFFDAGLATNAPDIFTMAVFAIIVGDKYYATSLAISMMQLLPRDSYEVMIDDDAYTVFEFEKGGVITPNRNLVVRDTLVYNIWEFLISQGNRTFFLPSDTISLLFEEAREWTGVQLSANPAVIQMIVATVTRAAKNLRMQYRHAVKDDPTTQEKAVALRSIIYGPSNTLGRLNGPYAGEGLAAALNTTSERSEPLEELIRL